MLGCTALQDLLYTHIYIYMSYLVVSLLHRTVKKHIHI